MNNQSDLPEPLSTGENLDLQNMLLAMRDPITLRCEYKNWRGETSVRRIQPIRFWHGSTDWHPKPGLMLRALDMDKNAERDFCVADFNTATLTADIAS